MIKTLRWRTAQFFESLWWKNYLAKKDVAEYLRLKIIYWNKVLESISSSVKLNQNDNILDAGCGPAGIFIALKDHNVTAFDPLLDTYHQTLQHFKFEMYPDVKFKTDTLESFKSADEFDVVFCMNAINHVSELDKAFLTLHKFAKTGGKIIVSIDAHNRQFFKHVFRLQPADILHPHQYDLAEYKEMLTSLNCEIILTSLVKEGFLFNHYILVAEKK
ncbi:methyltransferase domain-containing protein [Pedobacter sp. Du54]|uniref:class I SAM-dependent methyltransferase n=1 Tax=Pedobacter anseongensis TaxID=3133439 RepID=UPI0030A324E4